MANDYYTHGSTPATGSPGSSSVMRSEFDLVMAGFAKLPSLTGNGNRAVIVNAGGTALSLTGGTLALGGAFSTLGAVTIGAAFVTSGGHSLTLTTTGTTNVTLPTTGTVATLAGAETFTNKTITSPVLSGTATGTYTLGGTGTIATTKTSGHGIGSSGSATAGLTLSHTLTGAGSAFVYGMNCSSVLTGGVNDSIIGVSINNTITKAASGTHALIDGLFVGTPNISGSATATTASTVRIAGAPASGATNLYALNVENGTVRLASGSTLLLQSGRITFPAAQNASSDVNTLDDYEEGSWTPSIGGSATYITQTGRYVKIGKAVFISGTLSVNTRGTGSQTTVSGLPFTASVATLQPVSVVTSALSTTVVSVIGAVSASGTTITLYSRTSASNSDSINNVIGNGTDLYFTGCYEAST